MKLKFFLAPFFLFLFSSPVFPKSGEVCENLSGTYYIKSGALPSLCKTPEGDWYHKYEMFEDILPFPGLNLMKMSENPIELQALDHNDQNDFEIHITQKFCRFVTIEVKSLGILETNTEEKSRFQIGKTYEESSFIPSEKIKATWKTKAKETLVFTFKKALKFKTSPSGTQTLNFHTLKVEKPETIKWEFSKGVNGELSFKIMKYKTLLDPVKIGAECHFPEAV